MFLESFYIVYQMLNTTDASERCKRQVECIYRNIFFGNFSCNFNFHPMVQHAIISDKFLVLNSTFSRFDNCICKQNFGIHGFLSSIISDLVVCDLKERTLEILSFPLTFYVRYVDDIAMAVPSINDVLNIFNSFHPSFCNLNYFIDFKLE